MKDKTLIVVCYRRAATLHIVAFDAPRLYLSDVCMVLQTIPNIREVVIMADFFAQTPINLYAGLSGK